MKTKKEHVIVLGSLDKPDTIWQFNKLLKMIQKDSDRDVIIDLSDITINSSIISSLLKLLEVTKDARRELILCGINTQVMSVFTVSGIDGIFHLTKDRLSAMDELKEIRQELLVEMI